MAFKMKGFSGFGNSPAKQKTDLTKKQTGPRADKKQVKQNDDAPLSPGFEDPIKIQKVQREGLTPYSQKFSKIAKENVKSKDYEKYSDLEKYDDDRPSPNKKRGLWDNIHAKRKRGEKMRKPGSKGAPTDKALKESQSPNKLLGIKKKADAARKSLGNAAGIPGDPVA